MGDQSFISEFPNPPAYYALFTGENALNPPEIPNEAEIIPYAGAVPQPVQLEYDESKDYKQVLKAQAAGISKLLLELANPRNRTPIDRQKHEIENKVEDFATTLNECRIHMGREELIRDMKRELTELQTLRDSMQSEILHVTQVLSGLAANPSTATTQESEQKEAEMVLQS